MWAGSDGTGSDGSGGSGSNGGSATGGQNGTAGDGAPGALAFDAPAPVDVGLVEEWERARAEGHMVLRQVVPPG